MTCNSRSKNEKKNVSEKLSGSYVDPNCKISMIVCWILCKWTKENEQQKIGCYTLTYSNKWLLRPGLLHQVSSTLTGTIYGLAHLTGKNILVYIF
jgi:hypothetical protein